MTIDGLSRSPAPVEPWVDLGEPDQQTALVRGSVRIVEQGDRAVRFGPEQSSTAKGGLVAVDPRTGRFTYTPSVAARQVSRTSTSYRDKVDTFTVDVVDAHGSRAEAHVVVEILAAHVPLGEAAGAGRACADRAAQPSGGLKTNTMLGAKEVQWSPITTDGGSVSILSTSGGTSALSVGPAGDHTLTFTSSGGGYFNKGPAGSVVLRVTDPSGSHTDRTYTY
ncbi:hypothetical protein C6A86_012790 [Mycobacterium sp. ITM-2016-00316]|uniref:hypothetical protein n=1 Tax=Mycobacterium sp. ITM-2016-00316 TaxID=2099695 RepID=UPI000CF8A25D|nr:hypothetical protein [Mycobacterium sp. ITM-2016-00316]WNG84448.1 hypothetical protein C6A86_012790 [Mycobacterium sp. ITM-2016-00316]